jgi:hypothetical protein
MTRKDVAWFAVVSRYLRSVTGLLNTSQDCCPLYLDIPVKLVPFIDITLFADVMTCRPANASEEPPYTLKMEAAGSSYILLLTILHGVTFQTCNFNIHCRELSNLICCTCLPENVYIVQERSLDSCCNHGWLTRWNTASSVGFPWDEAKPVITDESSAVESNPPPPPHLNLPVILLVLRTADWWQERG